MPGQNLDALLFLASVILISLSGVMMPGPMFAVTVSNGYRDKKAGIFVALGHAVIEVPTMLLVYLGISRIVSSAVSRFAVGIFGGLILLYMGIGLLRQERPSPRYCKKIKGSLRAGMITTLANPYFFIWWTSVGAALILGAKKFGIGIFLAFMLVHWLCDLFWCAFVSAAAFSAGRVWSVRGHLLLMRLSAFILIGFGAWFILCFSSGLKSALSASGY